MTPRTCGRSADDGPRHARQRSALGHSSTLRSVRALTGSLRAPIGRRHLLALAALLVVPTAASVADHPLAAHGAPSLHQATDESLVASPAIAGTPTERVTAPGAVTVTTLARAGETIWSIAEQVDVAPGALLRHNRPSPSEPSLGDHSIATSTTAARSVDHLAAGERLVRAEAIVVPVRSADDAASVAPDVPTAHPVVADPDLAALEPTFDRWADHFGVPRGLLKALTWVESGWDNNSRSASGGIGIGRLQPVRAQYLADHVAKMALDPAVAVDNIALTAAQLRVLLDETPDVSSAIAAHRQGVTDTRLGGVDPSLDGYVDAVLAARARFV